MEGGVGSHFGLVLQDLPVFDCGQKHAMSCDCEGQPLSPEHSCK